MIRPVFDLMQTMPAFVYLIPGCSVFRTGTCSGRFCHRDIRHASGCPSYRLGIRQVPEDIVEATRSFGATSGQLFKVQLPVGFTYHYGRREPDNHDGSSYGCDCGHDLGWRIRWEIS